MTRIRYTVAFDVSILGWGQLNPRARTGIFHMTEQLLLQFAKHDEIDLTLVAASAQSSLWDEACARLYLQEERPGMEGLFRSGYQSKRLAWIAERLAKGQKRVLQAIFNHPQLLQNLVKATRLPVQKAGELRKREWKNPSFRLYHSTYLPLPDDLPPYVQRVLTVNDLVPIRCPQFCNQAVVDNFRRSLDILDFSNDWVLCVSHYTKKDFCAYTGMDPERVFVTHLAAHRNFAPVTSKSKVQQVLQRYKIPDQPYILSLATLEPRKNLSALVRSFVSYLGAHPKSPYSLVLVGANGWDNQDVFRSAASHPLAKKKIVFTGYARDEDLSALYSGADLFVYPSLFEGFGLPPLEAMQCGTPVLCSNRTSLPEVVGDAGVLVDPEDEGSLFKEMEALLADPERRQHLSQLGFKQAATFSWARCAEETFQVYKHILEQAGR